MFEIVIPSATQQSFVNYYEKNASIRYKLINKRLREIYASKNKIIQS